MQTSRRLDQDLAGFGSQDQEQRQGKHSRPSPWQTKEDLQNDRFSHGKAFWMWSSKNLEEWPTICPGDWRKADSCRHVPKESSLRGRQDIHAAQKTQTYLESQARRLQFAKDYIHWTADDWRKVMFSNETIISRIGSFGKAYYHSRPHQQRLRPLQVKQAMQGDGVKMMY
jgi:hypothetical protein